jgi:hypothetical protein
LYDPASEQSNSVSARSQFALEPPEQYQAALAVPSRTTIDPFQYSSLRDATLDLLLTKQACSVLGDVQQVGDFASSYFSGIHLRVPILSQRQYLEQLANLYTQPSATFTLLCLCIQILVQRPDGADLVANYAQTMQSSTYMMVKSFLGVLQSLATPTLELVQAMVLTVLYEVGHGMFPAASMSLATCARLATFMGLSKKGSIIGVADQLLIEQRRRVWWTILILDRFINLSTGDKMFALDDPQMTDTLPMDLDTWESEAGAFSVSCSTSSADLCQAYADVPDIQLTTPSDIRVGPFARECQVSHLIGRVVRHIFDPAADATFQRTEANQLDQTLNAFLPLLMEQESRFGLFCAALGMCSK